MHIQAKCITSERNFFRRSRSTSRKAYHHIKYFLIRSNAVKAKIELRTDFISHSLCGNWRCKYSDVALHFTPAILVPNALFLFQFRVAKTSFSIVFDLNKLGCIGGITNDLNTGHPTKRGILQKDNHSLLIILDCGLRHAIGYKYFYPW